jgi:hypothetical protein
MFGASKVDPFDSNFPPIHVHHFQVYKSWIKIDVL